MEINNIPKSLRNKVQTFVDEVMYHFKFLEEYNYKVDRIGIATQYAIDNVIEICYKNDSYNRYIVVHYEPIDIDDNVVDLVSVSLFKDSILGKNELVLKKYLKKYKSELEIEHLTYPDKYGKGTFKENMKTSISGFAYFLMDAGNNLVDGSEWEDNLTYDWSSIEDTLYKAQKDELDKDQNNDFEDIE